MKLTPNETLVIIMPEAIPDKSEQGNIILPDLVKENKAKLQNRGTVVWVGSECKFCVPKDFVSFYRNAATPVVQDGKEYLVIHEDHILCKIEEDED